ncbi:MAG: 1-deoxy-D-xylulose-5-phosphate reductoisomerase [Acidimicrobiales bacterium]|nr:MAG: 1-deoxy-D-xylulose-5-phosphate reductoisomerase [Acidimicrobiales bacterium]
MRDVVVMGSTGSVGVQALDVIASHPNELRVVALAAGGAHIELLAQQALITGAAAVAINSATAAQDLQLALHTHAHKRGHARGSLPLPKILAGPQAASELATWPADVVLNGITGSVGLAPTLAALHAGRTVALANKESLVAGGPLVRAALAVGSQAASSRSDFASGPKLVPVDSEHTALLQCLRAGRGEELRRLILTASGGPFRGYTAQQLEAVTLRQALAHPTWSMGPVITVNSATLVNKGLELIEAHELYNVGYDDIDVVVHPESLVHSMVEFCDGSTIAQLSQPDMKLTIGLALTWPNRLHVPPSRSASWDWQGARAAATTWHFESLDEQVFPAVALARSAGLAGRCNPAIYNAANEECVAAFRQERLKFSSIVPTITEVLSAAPSFDEPRTVEDVLVAENWARGQAQSIITGDGGLRQT